MRHSLLCLWTAWAVLLLCSAPAAWADPYEAGYECVDHAEITLDGRTVRGEKLETPTERSYCGRLYDGESCSGAESAGTFKAYFPPLAGSTAPWRQSGVTIFFKCKSCEGLEPSATVDKPLACKWYANDDGTPGSEVGELTECQCYMTQDGYEPTTGYESPSPSDESPSPSYGESPSPGEHHESPGYSYEPKEPKEPPSPEEPDYPGEPYSPEYPKSPEYPRKSLRRLSTWWR